LTARRGLGALIGLSLNGGCDRASQGGGRSGWRVWSCSRDTLSGGLFLSSTFFDGVTRSEVGVSGGVIVAAATAMVIFSTAG
jgi:hypothetical protein